MLPAKRISKGLIKLLPILEMLIMIRIRQGATEVKTATAMLTLHGPRKDFNLGKAGVVRAN